ncbi:hypothetical protein [Blastococcus sp. LR1]|uniref:hypothetical protein n=1 Tax=Blastococcus sp. LR1 TaxID=2877000 RepID=UPI001CC983ED|nr:hypothetical protein [Blastococcus sp. LR1]MCA0145568.1 hypothetical protein [Blastococcus sp. LR1]
MPVAWTHVGRFWTNGEPFLAVDEDLLPAWRGMSDEAYEALVPHLDYELSSIPVGAGSAAIVLTDPEIGDEGWLEVFRGDDGSIAVLQVSAENYRDVLELALRFPATDDQPGDGVAVPSGRLAFVSAALDGTGDDGALLMPESPGATPQSDDAEPDDRSPLLVVPPGSFTMSVRWRTELGEDAAFARWTFARVDR